MSTWLYLRCESHDPPLKNDGESGWNLYNLEQIWADISNRDVIAAAWLNRCFPDDSLRRNTAAFLAKHTHCQIGVIDEYGRIHHPDGTVQEKEDA